MDYAAYLFGNEHPFVTLGLIVSLAIVGMGCWAAVQFWRIAKGK